MYFERIDMLLNYKSASLAVYKLKHSQVMDEIWIRILWTTPVPDLTKNVRGSHRFINSPVEEDLTKKLSREETS